MFARPAGRVLDARHFLLRFPSPEEMLGITALVLTVLCALVHAGSADNGAGSVTLAFGESSPTDVTFDGAVIAASATSGPQGHHGARY